MVEKKKQSFGELLEIEAGEAGIEAWLRHAGIYAEVMDAVQAGARPSLIYRTLKNNYGYVLDFWSVKALCDEYGTRHGAVQVQAAEAEQV